MIDLHCHLLPGIDDGPGTLEGAVQMAQLAVADGVERIVCTPHINHSYPGNSAARIAEAVDSLRGELAAAGVPLQIDAGGEVALTRALELDDDELRALSLAGSGLILLELPIGAEVPRAAQLVRSVLARGHRVLLAHPERCLSFHQQPHLLSELVEAGCSAQLTTGSLAGDFGRTVRRLAHQMLADGLVHVISSDAHDPHHRSPRLADPLRPVGFADAAIEQACALGPAALLAGESVPACSPVRRPGGLRGRFGRER